MSHVSASLKVTNATVSAWTQSSGTLGLHEPIGNVTVTCVAEAKPVTISLATETGSRTARQESHAFYVEEANQVILKANTGYRFTASTSATVSNTQGSAVTTLSSDLTTATISFTPNSNAATDGCEISISTTVKKYIFTINTPLCDIDPGGGTGTHTASIEVQEGSSVGTTDIGLNFGYYFSYTGTESSYTWSGESHTGTANVVWEPADVSKREDIYWDTSMSDSEGIMKLSATNVQSDVTVNIVPTGAQFTLKQKSSETATLPDDTTVTYSESTKIIPIQAATRTHYTLSGWKRTSSTTVTTWNPEGNVDINLTNFPSSSDLTITIWAAWSLINHTVTVTYTNCKEYSKSTPEASSTTVIVPDDASANLTINPLWGYQFTYGSSASPYSGQFTPSTGISVSTSSTTDIQYDGQITISITATQDGTLTLSSIAKVFTVAYHLNCEEGSGTINPTTVTYAGSGTTIHLDKGDNFSRTYWHFDNWNSLATGLGTDYNKDADIDVNATNFPGSGSDYDLKTVYAKWIGNTYSIGVNVTGCTNDSSSASAITRGSSATVKINPNAGYTLPSGYTYS